MSQFIKAIEIDQTPVKMMSQWSSELAEEANRASQRQQALLKMQQEQEAALGNAFGEFYKYGLDYAKDLTAEQRDIALESFKKGLAKSLNDSKRNPAAFKVSALTGPLTDIVRYSSFRKEVANAGAEISKQLEAQGYNPKAIQAFAGAYMLDPENIGKFNIEDFQQALQKDLEERKHLYVDKNKGLDIINKSLEEKGEDLERSVALDPTGKNKKTVDVKVPVKYWDKIVKVKQPNGIEVDMPVLNTEEINGMKVITGDVYKKFLNNNASAKAWIDAEAKNTVHDINNKMGVNTAGMTYRDFSIAKSKNPNLIDPFNDGVLEVYARNAVTKMLAPKYDENGVSKLGKQAYGNVFDNPAKTTVNINNGQTTPQIDLVGIVSDKISADKAEAKKNNVPYKWTQINTLDDRVKDAVMDKAKSGLPDAVKQSVGQESFYIKPGQSRGKSGIGVYAAVDIKDPNNIDNPPIYKAGQFVSWVGGGAAMKANEKLGKPAVQNASREGGGVKEISKNKSTQTITKDAFRKMSIPDRQKFISGGGKVE